MKERKLAHQNRIWLANGPHVNFVVFTPGDQHSGRLLPNFQTIYIWCMCHKLLCKTLPSQGEHHHHLSYCVAATDYKSHISWNPNMHKPNQKPKKNAQHSSLEDTQLISSLHVAKLFDCNFSFLLSFLPCLPASLSDHHKKLFSYSKCNRSTRLDERTAQPFRRRRRRRQ